MFSNILLWQALAAIMTQWNGQVKMDIFQAAILALLTEANSIGAL